MTEQQADVVNRDTVVIAVSESNDQADISHRVSFLGYSVTTDASAADTKTVCAVIADRATLDCGLKVPGDTPVILLRDASQVTTALPRIGVAPLWPVEKPLRRARLAHLLTQATEYRGNQRRQRLTGASASIARVRRQIEQVAPFDTSVLVIGESGTGKELVARTVHDLSTRSGAAFVPVNCGAIPGELLESELFGHEKGAFTGAVNARKGRFEMAEGGTLFLDEIGDMPMPMQVKLLRVLQERQFQRVGSSDTRHCDVRIVAATHHDLRQAVAEGRFREDLFYRLCVFPIDMPPLRKRLEDIPGLLSELTLTGQEHTSLRLQPCALAALARYEWPGNVRELGNLVERLAILHPNGTITAADLPEKFRSGAVANDPIGVGPTVLPEHGVALREYLKNLERTMIESALTRSDGVVARAARLLGMRRTTLVEKLRAA